MTSGVAGPPTPQPASAPPHEPIRALLRAGKNDEAIVRLAAITVTRPDDLDAKELLFDAFFQKRDWLPALAIAEELVRRRPDVARLQQGAGRHAVQHETFRRGDPACLAIYRALRRGPHRCSTRSKWRISIPARSTRRSATASAVSKSRDAEAANVPRTDDPDRTARPAAGRQRHFVFAVGHRAVLRLRRHDQSGAVPQRLSGLEPAAFMSTPRCRSLASRICATTARMCVSWKTNIPASACSSASW